MIKLGEKVTCRLNLLLLCLKLRKYSQKSTKVIKRTPSGHLSKVGVLEHLVGGSNKRGVSQMDLSLKFCIGVVEVTGFSYSEFAGAN